MDNNIFNKWNSTLRNSYLIMFLVLAISCFANFEMLVRQHAYGDYVVHIKFAKSMLNEGQIPLAHFGYHALILLIRDLLPISTLNDASIILLSIAAVATTYLIWRILRNLAPNLSPVLTGMLCLSGLIMTPASILTQPIDVNYYWAYIHPTPYHNPTYILLRPFALFLFLQSMAVFEKSTYRPKRIVFVAVLLILTTLVKPNFTVCLIPAIVLLALWHKFRAESINWRLLIWGLIVPTLVILAWQYLFEFSDSDKAGIKIAPFEVMNEFANGAAIHGVVGVIINLLLALLFPIMLIIVDKQILDDKRLQLAWLTFSAGAAQIILFVEVGARANHGNFLWSGHIGLFVLYIVSVSVFVERLTTRNYEKWRYMLLFFLLGLHIVSGILWYSYSYQFPGFQKFFW